MFIVHYENVNFYIGTQEGPVTSTFRDILLIGQMLMYESNALQVKLGKMLNV